MIFDGKLDASLVDNAYIHTYINPNANKAGNTSWICPIQMILSHVRKSARRRQAIFSSLCGFA